MVYNGPHMPLKDPQLACNPIVVKSKVLSSKQEVYSKNEADFSSWI